LSFHLSFCSCHHSRDWHQLKFKVESICCKEKNEMKKNVRTSIVIAIAVLIALLISSSLAMIGNSQVTRPPTASITATPLSSKPNYGSLLQYEWPLSGSDEGNTGMNSGPGPDRANLLWNVSGRGSGEVSAFNGMLFTTSGTIVYATNAFDGSLVYTSDAPGTAAIHTLNGVQKLDETYFVTTGIAGITIRKIATGELVSRLDTPNPSSTAGSSGYFAGKYSSTMKMYFDHAVDPVTHNNQIIAHDVSNPLSPRIAWTYNAVISSETLFCGDGKVFLGSTEASVYALDARNGTRVWETSTFGGLVQQSAIYYNGCLYTSAVSWQITCFNGTTGEIVWQADKGIRAFSAYRGAAGAGMIFDATDELDPYGTIGAWDAATGERLWKQPGYFNIHYATMAYADGKLYGIKCDQAAGRTTGGLMMPGSSTSCWDAYTGTELWNLPGISFSSPTIAYGNLYGISGGRLYCIGGNPTDWSQGFQGNVANQRVSGGQQGPVDISTARWEFQTGGDVFSSPAVAAGKVYVGSHDKNWYCLDAFTGQKIWNFTVGHYVRSSAAVSGGKVFTGADDGYFYALDANTGAQLWKVSAGGFFPQYLDPNEAELCSSLWL
jgi:eukaryotic-like serine/threonine-protein kinase